MLEFFGKTVFDFILSLTTITTLFVGPTLNFQYQKDIVVPEKPTPLINIIEGSEDNRTEESVSEENSSGIESKPSDDTSTQNIMTTTSSTFALTQPEIKSVQERLRDSIVNIFCYLDAYGERHPLTASGVLIDKRGVILTNAHVGQYIMLDNYLDDNQITCKIRQGSPARDSFETSILYISPQWIVENSESFLSPSPFGTGEKDYALLLTKKLPTDRFQYLDLKTDDSDVEKDQNIFVGSYPAGILDNLTIAKSLFSVVRKSTIKEILTFHEDTIDVISTGGSYLAQRGSSGGGVTDKDGNLIGLIVTSTQEEDTDDRDLRAVTLSHINRDLADYAETSLEKILSEDVHDLSHDFQKEIVPMLAKKLLDADDERSDIIE